MKKKVIASIVLVVALAGGVFTVSQMEKIPTGRVGVQYSLNGGVKDEVLDMGVHFVLPGIHVKEFTIGNEQLILSKDKREGSEGGRLFQSCYF